MNDINMAAGPAGSASLESSYSEAFSQSSDPKKPLPQFFEMSHALLASDSGMFIPPEMNGVEEYFDYIDHPEAECSDDEDDDDMDYDLPSTALTSPAMGLDLKLPGASDFDSSNVTGAAQSSAVPYGSNHVGPSGSYYSSYPPQNENFTESAFLRHVLQRTPNTSYYGDFAAPVDAINPMSLQLSSEFTHPDNEGILSFGTSASPVICEEPEFATQEMLIDSQYDQSGSRTESVSSVSSVVTAESAASSWSQYDSPESPESQQEDEDFVPTQRFRAQMSPKILSLSHDQELDRGIPTRPAVAKAKKRNGQLAFSCDIILASGEPCHKAFTRPYDLSRHQETIHAAVRKTFRCQYCGESSKTFSRMDALSRHIRIKHPKE